MGGLILLLIFVGIIYLVFSFFRKWMLLIGIIVLVIGIILTIIAMKNEEHEGLTSAIIWDIAGGVMIALGIYIKWFMPGA